MPSGCSNIDDVDSGSVDCYKLYGYSWDQCGYCRGVRAISSPDKQQQTFNSSRSRSGDAEDEDDGDRCQGDNNGNKNTSTYRSYLTKLDSTLRPSSYESLMCRGWRRSGTIIYKPDNAMTCCPQHTIRLPITDFVLNKEQRKVIRKMHSVLLGGQQHDDTTNKQSRKQHRNDAVMAFLARNGVLTSLVGATETHLASLLPACDNVKEAMIPPVRYKLHGLTNAGGGTGSTAAATNTTASLTCSVCTALVTRKVIDKKTATDLANRLVRILQSNPPVSNKILISSISATAAGMVRVEVPVPDDIDRSPTTTTTDPLAAWFQARGMNVPTERVMQVKTLPATESAATDPRVHQLYWDYQEIVHGDEHPLKSSAATTVTTDDEQEQQHQSGRAGASVFVDPRARPILERAYGGGSSPGQRIPWQAFASFWDFLVHSPLGSSTIHQHYTVGEALVAVGVLDVLPTGVSSVYCFYDPSFSQLVPLGTYTALREIEYTRSIQRPYYYLGYYIESNPKMNYKGDYIGSQIRCATTGEWVGVADARKVLRRDERARLYVGSSDQQSPAIATPQQHIDVGTIPILTNQGIIHGNILQDEDKEYFYPFLEEWVALAGPDVALTGTVDIREP